MRFPRSDRYNSNRVGDKVGHTTFHQSFYSSVDIPGGLGDFWAYIRAPRPHRWASWGLSLAITAVVFYYLTTTLIPYHPPQRQIIYVESWAADRDADSIHKDWIARAKATTHENALRRANYQRLADMLGVAYDSSEADTITRETLGADIYTQLHRPATVPSRRAIGVQSDLAARAINAPPSKPASQP